MGIAKVDDKEENQGDISFPVAGNGEDKLLAVARHIAKTLGQNDTMADDILQIFSNFDGRFSRERLSENMVDANNPRGCAALDRPLHAFLVAIDEMIRAESFEPSRNNHESNENSSFDSDDENEENEEGLLHNGADLDHQIPVAQPVTDYDIIIDALPSGTINDLYEIAKRMVAAGFGKECSHVYSTCRREFLEESISRLGLQKLGIDEVQKMPWQELEDEIERWIKAANASLRILFPSERRLCDRIFFGFSSAADLSFMEVCRVLDVFETMRDLMPEFDSVFSDQCCLVLRNEAITIWKRLGEAIRGIFMELENLIRRDPAKAAVPGGGLYPIIRYAMNYLRAACRSRQTLEQVFDERNAVVPSNKLDDKRVSSSSMSVQMAWIMELLESNLEMKSRIYRDSGLCSIFFMNNGRYIVQKVKDSELESFLGDDWIRKHTAKVRQNCTNYQRSSWNKILGALKLDNSSLASNAIVKSMKEKIKSFNSQFEDACKTQSSWVVFDEQLRISETSQGGSNLSLKSVGIPIGLSGMVRMISRPGLMSYLRAATDHPVAGSSS
ncbi:Exocyst complex component EXO70B1 [Hibiscus syriacus]|uniref:Exocyst subunit Exo70 family protein n=1 Tax=Hibiscus syriacus TaxID=106335 RepID=A0A6A3BD71_HIBSY|nr:Exocyst complex component EXO70B1 [Hibiscus syriacus]